MAVLIGRNMGLARSFVCLFCMDSLVLKNAKKRRKAICLVTPGYTRGLSTTRYTTAEIVLECGCGVTVQ